MNCLHNKKHVLLLIMLHAIIPLAKSQPRTVNTHEKLILRSEIDKCLLELKTNPNNGPNAYNLACKYSLLNKVDSSFYFLNLAIDLGEDDGWALYDPDFYTIKQKPNWLSITAKINQIYIKKNPSLDTAITFQLRELYFKDQAIRAIWQTLHDTYGEKSIEVDSIKKEIQLVDSLNLSKFNLFISRYGWPTKKLVGEEGMTTVFLLIQHSPLNYQKKYFPQMQKSANNGDIPLSDVAYLTDRILVHENKKQLYGTQLKHNKDGSYELYPMEDEKNVNVRRKEVGLGPIEEYAKNFGFEYISK
jgi:hypothetical protein